MNGNKPLVSAIIPTYNRWPLVCESIDSALAQDYPNLEVIVVDDGSTDATAEELPRRYGDRVRYIRQENRGPSAARNAGIEAARGEFIAFLDSDDLWHPEKTSRQIAAIAGHEEYGFVYNTCNVLAPDGTKTSGVQYRSDYGVTGDNFEVVLREEPTLTPAMLVRKKALMRVGLFDPSIVGEEDKDLWLRLALKYPGAYIKTPLTWVREHPGRWTHYIMETGLRGKGGVRVYENLLANLPPDREHLRPLIRERLQEARLAAIPGVAGDDWGAFLEHARDVMAQDPEAMLSDFAHQGLARAVLAVEAVTEEQARDVEELLRETVREHQRRCRAMFRCALARKLVMTGQHGLALRHAARALLISPKVFATNLVAVVLTALLRGVYRGPR